MLTARCVQVRERYWGHAEGGKVLVRLKRLLCGAPDIIAMYSHTRSGLLAACLGRCVSFVTVSSGERER